MQGENIQRPNLVSIRLDEDTTELLQQIMVMDRSNRTAAIENCIHAEAKRRKLKVTKARKTK